MFEREVMISTLRKNSIDLAKLVEELEDKPRFDGIDLTYYKEVLKKIENGLRAVRKIEARMNPVSEKYGTHYANCAW